MTEIASENARLFWEAGLKVFGLHGGDAEGRCACGWEHCPAAFKHPLISNWQKTPEWSEDQIDAMEMSGQFKTGFGVLCSGLLVVDVDARNEGNEAYAKLLEAVPEVAGAGMIVETGSGGGSKHLYFRAPAGVALMAHLPGYKGLDFKSSGYVVGPGSLHVSGNRYTLAYGTPDEIEDAPAALVEMLRQPERHRAEYDGRVVDVSHGDLAEMLDHIDNEGEGVDYETWIRCGMSVHHSSGGTAFETWDRWSQRSSKYDAKATEYKWHSFGRSANPVTFGTLAHYAEAGGWTMPVEFVPTVQFDLPEDRPEPDGLPFDITGVDLKRPPGFVGKLTEWINGQCRRPRENLAVAAALSSMGNIAGLRYTDDLDGVSCNLFTFCVAGSGTGKEAVQTAQTTIHKVAGMAEAQHGNIKSEQEITRNLIQHQAAIFVIDEIGIFLKKVKNAQERGGAIYLDGVIGILMSAYSKANSFMLLGGDVRREMEALLKRERAALQKSIDENDRVEYCTRKLAAVERSLNGLGQGLERPLLSVAGYTTPETFDDLMDFQSATNGFIGRALIFNDRDTAPRSKRGFKPAEMPFGMKTTLAQIFGDGEFDLMGGHRVEYYGEKRKIPTDAAARAMLGSCIDWFEAQAIEHKGKSGLEALYLRAYESVSKVSLILAVPEGIRTAECVRWAFALVKRDVEDKARLVIANDREKDSPKMAMAARILNIIAGDGETLGVIVNRMRKYRRADVEKTLATLVESGEASVVDIIPPRGGKATKLYRKE